jgi:hypothetical protein
MIRVMRVAPATFRSRLAIVLALLALFGVGGFFAIKALDEGTKDEELCTLVGCTSGIEVELEGLRHALPQAATVQLCAGAGCTTYRLRDGRVSALIESEWRGVPKHPNASYTADLTVLDRRGRVLLHLRRAVRLTKSEPNGHACGPTCWNAALKLDATHGRLLPVRS